MISASASGQVQITVSPASIPVATAGTFYSETFNATGGVDSYAWSASLYGGGPLPSWLTINQSSGTLSGTPITSGTFTIVVTATDMDGNVGYEKVSLLVTPPVAFSPSSGTLPSGVQNQSYSLTLQASNGSGNYSWSVTSQSAGLNLGPSSGTGASFVLSGTPTVTNASPGLSLVVTLTDTSSGQHLQQSYLIPVYAPLSVNPPSETLPNGHTSQVYSVALRGSGGSGNYSWSITSESAGLNLGPAMGAGATFALTGTPTVAGNFTLIVTLTDTTTSQSLQQSYLVPVSAPLVVMSTTSSLATSTGGSVSGGVTATGGVPPYSFIMYGQPPGVTIGSGGSFSGTPSQAGTFNATVAVTDSAANSTSTPILINVLGLMTANLPGGTAGQFYSGSVSATGGASGYSFSASGVPSGLSMSTSGALTGTTKAGGTYSLNVTVTSGAVSASGVVSLVIAPPQPFSITGSFLPAGNVNVPYSQSLSATGGIPPYTWTISAGALPAGLSIATGGIVSGTPTTAGTVSFSVQATDSAGATATASTSLLIHAPPLVVTTTTLPSGMNGVDYPQQALAATGGVSPYTWAISSPLPSGATALPAGMTLGSNGTLSGTPSAAGTFAIGVTVTDSATPPNNTPATISLTIRPQAPDLILTTSSLNFALSSPATTLPVSQAAGVQATVPTQIISYTASIGPGVPWLSISNGSTTPDTIQVSLTSAALALSPGSYQTTITATCTSTACAGHTQTVAVNLTVTALAPKLQIDTSLLSFATTSANNGTISQPIVIENTGGGTISFTSMGSETGWCTVAASSAGLGGGGNVSIPVTVNPSLLQPGFYRTQVDIATSAGNGSVPVTLFIAANSSMTLAPSGQQFSMPAGSAPGNPNGSFLVSVNNATPVNYTVTVLPGSSWLTLGTTSGTSSSTQSGTVSFSIDPTAAGQLSQGAFYGRIEVTSTGVSNSPQDFEVVLNVTAPTAAEPPDPEPGGLLFITGSGGVLPPETVTVYSGSTTPLTFQTSVATSNGSGWLSVTPATGSSSASAPGVAAVSVDPTGLSAGVYTGSVNFSLSATAVRGVNVTLIIPAGTATSSAIPESSLSSATPPGTAHPRASGCSASTLVPTQTGLVNSFSAPAGWPTPLAILLYNDCGQTVTNGQVVATFSNGDPPLALALADPSKGLYSGTWSPAKAASQVSIVVTADAPGLPEALSRISGAVTANAVPVLTPNGTLHSFYPLVGGALAPGTIVQIYGQNFASAAAQPTAIPLPTAMGGVSVVIGGMPAPLYYVSATQINAQIPFELQAGQQYQVIVSANNALTTPDSIQLSAATPGFAAFTDGTLIAQHNADGSLVSQTSPAQAGEYLIAYLAGMGDTNIPVPSGTASPSSPLATPDDTAQLTINGTQYPLAFAGLTPGLVGLYQVDFQVPVGLPAGNITITISQNGQTSNQTTLPYQP